MGKFDGKVAVVTGGGQSVGRIMAQMFANEGAHVVVTGRTASKIEATADLIGRDKATPFVMDIALEEDWVKLATFLKEKFGEIDYLVNNAAIILGKSIFDMSLEEFRQTEKTNLESVFLGMKYCYGVLKKGCYSAIVNVSSAASKMTGPTLVDGAYAATKAGVNMLSKHAAYFFGKDCIRVNTIIVGGINTAMREAYIQQHPEALEIASKSKAIPPYCSEAEEIAAAVLMACDPACRTMTGSEITIDAGMLIM